MQGLKIREGYTAGAIGRVVEMHGAYYHRNWGFSTFFEAKVASELAAFMGRYERQQDGFWTASADDRICGSITIDGAHANRGEGAHLRWFIVSDAARGTGLGSRLLTTALNFCRARQYPAVYLWTFEGLCPARHLYEKAGFSLTEQHPGNQWGTTVVEQRFALRLRSSSA